MKANEALEQLNLMEELCNQAIDFFRKNDSNKLNKTEAFELSKLLSRMFIAEREYLYSNPQSYISLYGTGIDE